MLASPKLAPHPQVCVEDMADIVCRCGRAYFFAGFPQHMQCQCRRWVFGLDGERIFVLSERGSQGAHALSLCSYTIDDHDSAALALAGARIMPSTLEPGELPRVMLAAEFFRSIDKDGPTVRRLAQRFSPRVVK